MIYVTNKFLQKRYPTYGEQISCSDVKTDIRKESKSKSIDLDRKKLIFGTIGALDIKYKGQEYVIKAIAYLKRQGYDIEYQLVGPGTGKRLKKIAKRYKVIDNIKFIGILQHDQIFNWLNNINIYIQPSTTEGLPRSLIEAMSQGCFCIGSNVGGIPELLEEKFIFKKRNFLEIVKIIKSISNKDLKQQSINNIEKSKEFEENKLCQNRKDFFDEIFIKENLV